jgi:prepilin-type N-terminal cleavage/methylation domain-containing protein
METQAGQWKIKHEQGMTMVEMVIVLAMTAVFSVFMGTGLQAMADRVYLDAAVAELVGDLRYARSMAVREEQLVQVAVDSGQPAVTLFRASDPGQPVAPARNLMSRGVRAIRSTGGNLLSFYPRGTSATPTTLTLEDRRGIQRVVTVSLTGIVRAR